MLAQVIAICIFLGMFLLIILDQFEHHVITLVSGALVLILVFGVCMHSPAAIWEALNLRSFFTAGFWYGAGEESTAGINWSTILFIAGMMIMVEGLGKAGFFRWLCLSLAKLVHYHVVPLLICFMCLSAVLSMFIVAVCFAAVAVYFWLCFRKELLREERANGGPVVCPEPSSAITDRRAFGASAAVFLLAVVLLVTHAQTGLTVACIGVIVAALTLLVMALSHGRATVLEVIRGVDYKTLLFFIGLFVSVCGLEKTGVLDIIARFITNISGGHVATIVVIILWLSAVTSAFVDNIPFAATMIPVIRSIAAVEGMDVGVLAWALSLGTDLGGNATPIGASANVVGTSVSAKGGYPIGWGRYCKYCVPATILVMAVSTVCLFLRYL